MVNPSGASGGYEALGSTQISETDKQSLKKTMPSHQSISRERTIPIPIRTNASDPSAIKSHLVGFGRSKMGLPVCIELCLTFEPTRREEAGEARCNGRAEQC